MGVGSLERISMRTSAGVSSGTSGGVGYGGVRPDRIFSCRLA